MNAKLLNRVFRGSFVFKKECAFEKLVSSKLRHINLGIKLYVKRPKMWSIKCMNKWTLLIFPSGNFRIMGVYENPQRIARTVVKYLQKGTRIKKSSLKLQTETFTFDLGKRINLQRLMESSSSPYWIRFYRCEPYLQS